MSQQVLDLRRSVQTVRRHRGLVGVLACLGLLGGVAYAVLNPPLLSSTALVLLPNSASSVATQVVIAESDPVLSAALPKISPPVSLMTLRSEIHVKSLTGYVISVSAKGKTAADAEATANAVAGSYIAYVTPKYSPVGHVRAQILAGATNATGPGRLAAMLITGLIGALAGALLGVIVALVMSRNDPRLRERNDLANSMGVPVLASIPVGRPSDAAGWTRLLDDYKPGPVDAWQLHGALQQLTVAGHALRHGDGGAPSIAVLSLSSDQKAVALGPQLAVFAASQGLATVLALGPQQDTNATAALRTACATPSSTRSGLLRVTVFDGDDFHGQPHAALIITVVVVDPEQPKIPRTMRTTATVIGVSAGAATAKQLARIAVAAAADDREISGILLADPEPDDHTSGRIAQPPRPTPRRQTGQTRSQGFATEIRR